MFSFSTAATFQKMPPAMVGINEIAGSLYVSQLGTEAAPVSWMGIQVSTTQINRVTSSIIESAIRIHRAVGPGLLEKAYFGCLCFELHSSGLGIETQKPLPLVYRGVHIECAYRADLIVEGLVIVEIKALNGLAPIHRRQLLTYLRIADCPLGLLLDFGGETMKAGIKRVVNDRYTLSEHSTGAGRRPAE